MYDCNATDSGYADDSDFVSEGGSEEYYCHICKVNCTGPQPYQAHIQGEKHKRNAAKAYRPNGYAQSLDPTASGPYHCELCNISCTGYETFSQHVKGARHLKTLKVHGQTSNGSRSSTNGSSVNRQLVSPQMPLPKKVVGRSVSALPSTSGPSVSSMEPTQCLEAVGEEFVEPVVDPNSSVLKYYCKLCDCHCSDAGTKDTHLRGRRHRVQYKKDVCPDFDVDAGIIPKNKRESEEMFRKELMRVRQQVLFNIRATYQGQLMPKKPKSVSLETNDPCAMFGVAVVDKNGVETLEDRFVKAKHLMLSPMAEDIEAVKQVVVDVEMALKRLSDHFMAAKNTMGVFFTGSTKSSMRNLKGVVRVGPFADSALMQGEYDANLVVICEEKPTEFLARELQRLLLVELAGLSQGPYDGRWDSDECTIEISSSGQPQVTVSVALTSPTMRDMDEGAPANTIDPIDVLNVEKCLDALAQMRHTKWFQARCMDIKCCTMMLRVMRDICNRVDTWKPLSYWALELLIEKVLVTAGSHLSPGEAFRRIFEAVASGILLPDGSGLLDPCEKEIVDATWEMTPQEREDITASAHKALRLICFGKIHRILGVSSCIDELESQFNDSHARRKRPRSGSSD